MRIISKVFDNVIVEEIINNKNSEKAYQPNNSRSFLETAGGLSKDIFKTNVKTGGTASSNNNFKTNYGKINVGCLSRAGFCFSPDEQTGIIYEKIKINSAITEFTVVENNIAIGFMTRAALNEKLGGRYGFSLFSKSPIHNIMTVDFMSVDYNTPVDLVARIAMQRPFEKLYNPIVVEQDGRYSGIVTVKDLLDTCLKIARNERDEIALMRDNLEIGLFFIDRNFIIQERYSRHLEKLFSQNNLSGKNFADMLALSVTSKELESIKDYFSMVIDRSFDQNMLDDINPLTELHYSGSDPSHKKVFQCGFAAIEKDNDEVYALVSVYDITAKIELRQRLAEEENIRQEEMKSFFELIQVDPVVFGDFLEDADHEFAQIHKTLKDDTISAQKALVDIYQSVHAIKSNAVILGLNTFSNKVHEVESRIKKLREKEEPSFDEMLYLSIELEKLTKEKEGFKTTIEKIRSYRLTGGRKKNHHVLIESLDKTVNKVSGDTRKKVKFAAGKIDHEAIKKGPRRIIKEVLMQFIRNSVVHGIEMPQDRVSKGKDETGVIHLSIKMEKENIHIKFSDDGRGLDYKKIAEKALYKNLIAPKDADNKKALLKVLFSPGFSTAETESVYAGRGIGLNLVLDRVRSVNGSIKIHSKQGKGTVFNVYFPVKADEEKF